MSKEKTKNKNKRIRIIVIIISIILLLPSFFYLLIYLYNANKNKGQYENILYDVQNVSISEERPKANDIIEQVKQLQTENADVKGWIKIEDTNISYPLLQTTDNDYYLTHTYKKEKSSYGSIFINSNSDLKDNNSNVIIYGHNMKNNQMFTDLLKYKDKTFYEKHPIVKITTEEIEENYEIVYAFKSRIFYKEEKNVFKFYQYYGLSKESKYNEYVTNCRKIQLYDTGKAANYGEQLITLITCEYSQENGRMVVVAKKAK